MEWINVKDDLPENDTPVLVYMADRKTVMLTRYFGDFALARADAEYGFIDHGVTHWIAVDKPSDG